MASARKMLDPKLVDLLRKAFQVFYYENQSDLLEFKSDTYRIARSTLFSPIQIGVDFVWENEDPFPTVLEKMTKTAQSLFFRLNEEALKRRSPGGKQCIIHMGELDLPVEKKYSAKLTCMGRSLRIIYLDAATDVSVPYRMYRLDVLVGFEWRV